MKGSNRIDKKETVLLSFLTLFFLTSSVVREGMMMIHVKSAFDEKLLVLILLTGEIEIWMCLTREVQKV